MPRQYFYVQINKFYKRKGLGQRAVSKWRNAHKLCFVKLKINTAPLHCNQKMSSGGCRFSNFFRQNLQFQQWRPKKYGLESTNRRFAPVYADFLFNNVPSKALSKKNSDLKPQKIQNEKNVVGTCIHNKGFGTRQIFFIYLKRRQKEFIRLHVA